MKKYIISEIIIFNFLINLVMKDKKLKFKLTEIKYQNILYELINWFL